MMEITFNGDNDIENIEAPEGVSAEEVILAMKNLQEAPLWLQTPYQREDDASNTSLVETHRLRERESLSSVVEDIDEIVSTIRENRPDDPEMVSLALDDLENTLIGAKGAVVSDTSSDETTIVPTQELNIILKAANCEIDAMGDVGEDIHEFRDAYRRVKYQVSQDKLSEVSTRELGLILEAADREISSREDMGQNVDDLNEAYNTVNDSPGVLREECEADNLDNKIDTDTGELQTRVN